MTVSTNALITPETAPRNISELGHLGAYRLRALAEQLRLFDGHEQGLDWEKQPEDQKLREVHAALEALDREQGRAPDLGLSREPHAVRPHAAGIAPTGYRSAPDALPRIPPPMHGRFAERPEYSGPPHPVPDRSRPPAPFGSYRAGRTPQGHGYPNRVAPSPDSQLHSALQQVHLDLRQLQSKMDSDRQTARDDAGEVRDLMHLVLMSVLLLGAARTGQTPAEFLAQVTTDAPELGNAIGAVLSGEIPR